MEEYSCNNIMDSSNNKYVLVTAARNEGKYIENCLLSVISQSILPLKWVIVSDGSTDNTDSIVLKYSKNYDFIFLIRKYSIEKRNFGSQVESINLGHQEVKQLKYAYIGNLDADISFEKDYFKRLINYFEKNQRVGLAGGYIYEKNKGLFKSRKFNSLNSVAHAVQFFRRGVFDDIGGYTKLPYGGPDTYIETIVRMNGWEVKSIPELIVYHHRPTSSADGILKGSFRAGMMDYSLGYHPLYAIIKYFRRISGNPVVISALVRLIGFLWGYIKSEQRIVSDDFVRYFRSEQINKLKHWLYLRN